MLFALVSWITGWTVGTPFRAARLVERSPGHGDPAHVVVSLTYARLKPGGRRAFDRYTQAVFSSLDEQPGYLGGAIRREVFGRQVWTVTSWVDEASLESFVRSPLHREAVRVAGGSLGETQLHRLELPVTELPLSWDRVLDLLDERIGRTPALQPPVR
ncbi:MAG: antibiotic biosynthesis monooxygenase [Myxococcota bacterium]